MIRVQSSLRIRKNLYQTWSLNRMKTWKELWNFLSPKSLTSHQNALIWILSANHSIHQIVSIVHQGHKASHRDWSIDYHCDKFIPKTDTSWVGEFALSWFDEIPKHRRKKSCSISSNNSLQYVLSTNFIVWFQATCKTTFNWKSYFMKLKYNLTLLPALIDK